MITGEHDRLKALADNNLCSEHHTPLEVAWHSDERTWVLRCGHDHFPEAVSRNRSLTELNRTGELPDGPIKDNIDRRDKRMAMTNITPPKDDRSWLLPHADLTTGEILGPEAVKALTTYAERYSLDPYRGHVVMMHGKPYIGLDGYLYHALKGDIPFSLHSRPLNTEERKAYRIGENDHAWRATVEFKRSGAEFEGTGIVTREEMEAKSTRNPEQFKSPVVAKHPWQLCQKRAEWQAMRRAFPIGETEEVSNESSIKDTGTEVVED